METNDASVQEQSSPANEHKFPFIVATSNERPDSTTRNLVKRHVMRDIAKARRENGVYGKTNQLQLPEFLASDDALIDNYEANDPMKTADVANVNDMLNKSVPVDQNMGFLQPVERIGAGRHDPFVLYPIAMNSNSRQLVDYIFDLRIENLKPYRDAYYFCAIDDAAAFNQLLANTALHRALFDSKGKIIINNVALTYHSRAIKLANSRLGDPIDGLSDGMIATVLTMAAYNYILQDFESWNLHMSGLEQMIKLRGGIETLRPNQRLRLLIYWRHDIAGSCTLDQTPRFPFPEEFSPGVPFYNTHSSAIVQNMRRTWESCYPHHPQVSQMMNDLQSFNALLQRESNWSTGRIWADKLVSGFWLSSVLHRLLCLRSVVDAADSASHIREAFRLGGLLYLAEIRRQFGSYPVVMRVHIQKLRIVLQSHRTDWLEFRHLKIWTLVIASIEAEAGPDNAWLVQALVEMLRLSCVTTYDDLKELLQGLFWYPEVHDEGLLKVWSASEPLLSLGCDFSGDSIVPPI